MSKKDNKKELEKKEMLYNYWKELPLVITIDTPSEEILTHEARTLILYAIRKGKKEEDNTGRTRFRYAFSARELLELVNKKLDEKMKLQSMYFHLQKMQEAGLIEVITTLHQGRHNIAYFGRTARGFLFESKKEKSKYDDYFAEASRFAKALNPKISEEKFKDLLAKFKKINQESDKLTKKWLQERAEFINKNNIDTATMYSFLRRINYNRKEMNLIMKEIADLLEFNLNY